MTEAGYVRSLSGCVIDRVRRMMSKLACLDGSVLPAECSSSFPQISCSFSEEKSVLQVLLRRLEMLTSELVALLSFILSKVHLLQRQSQRTNRFDEPL